MKARKLAMGLVVAVMLAGASAASASDTKSIYSQSSTVIDPGFNIQHSVSWSDHSNYSINWLNASSVNGNGFGKSISMQGKNNNASWHRSPVADHGFLAGVPDINMPGSGFDYWILKGRQDQMEMPAASYQLSRVQAVPETNTLVGFGAALALNGIGVAGSGYYLRRRYNRASAKNYANRHKNTMYLYLDTAASVAVLLTVSPILIALAAAGALKTDKPAVFGAKIKY